MDFRSGLVLREDGVCEQGKVGREICRIWNQCLLKAQWHAL